jgi:hypothetical protein
MKSLLFTTVATLGLLASLPSNAQSPSMAEKDLANSMAAVDSVNQNEREKIVAYVQDAYKQQAALNDYWWRCIHDTACDAGWKDVPEKPTASAMPMPGQGVTGSPVPPKQP